MKNEIGLNEILNYYPVFDAIVENLDLKSLVALESTCKSNFKKIRSLDWKKRYVSRGGIEDVQAIDYIPLIRNIWRMEEETKIFDSRAGERNSIFKRIELARKITIGSAVSSVLSLMGFLPVPCYRPLPEPIPAIIDPSIYV